MPDGYDTCHLSKANPASVFFQFAKTDEYVSHDNASQFYEAASEPKKIEWYDGGHQMTNETARADRLAWLTEQLALK